MKVGDNIPIRVRWETTSGSVPTAAQATAEWVNATGDRTYWNGSAFTTTPATLTTSFNGSTGELTGDVDVPADWAGKVVIIVAEPTAPAAFTSYRRSREYEVDASDIDDLETDLDTVIADLTTLLSRLTEARAGYLDTLSTGGLALEATLTAMKGSGWTTESLASIQALVDELESRLTAARAAKLDFLDVAVSTRAEDASAGKEIGLQP